MDNPLTPEQHTKWLEENLRQTQRMFLMQVDECDRLREQLGEAIKALEPIYWMHDPGDANEEWKSITEAAYKVVSAYKESQRDATG